MKISVFGLGYVGAVSGACLAKRGHTVIGVDVSETKVNLINGGRSPVIEPEIDDLVGEVVKRKCFRATRDARAAIANTDVTFISVGTPSQANGSIDLQYVKQVCEQIGQALAGKEGYHIVVARSTMLPGSTRSLVIPTLEQHSGKKAGKDFGVGFNPEFLREGSSVYDFFNPPKTVIGTDDERVAAALREIYSGLPGEVFVVPVEVSEMVKYADNNFHAVKITFANEIGLICKSLGIDSHAVMDIFVRDAKLNISAYYLRPGFAFGGSCLPKDVNALLYQANRNDVETPLLRSLMQSNEKQIQRVVQQIMELGRRNVGVLGFSFKAGTDDLRGSPVVHVIETLIGKGYTLRLYDRNVNVSRLMGANRSYIEQHIPHFAALMCETKEEVIDASDVIIIGNKADEFAAVPGSIAPEKYIIDLVRIDRALTSGENYFGIAW